MSAQKFNKVSASARKLGQHLHSQIDFFAGEMNALDLINAGADVNARDADGNTPLIKATLTGKDLVVRTLLEKGVAIESTNKTGLSALAAAAIQGDKKTAGLLLQKGATLTLTQSVAAMEQAKDAAKTLEVLKLVARVQERDIAAPKPGQKK